MKILISPSAFKGTFTAFEVAEAIRRGVGNANQEVEIVMLPVSDGGEGFLDVILEAKQGTYRKNIVQDPLGNLRSADWGTLSFPPTAVIELAQIAGISLLPEEDWDPFKTTTYGVGQIIEKALNQGIRHFLIGLGDSATNDAGTGLLSALGARFLDKRGHELPPGGAALVDLEMIDLSSFDQRLQECFFTVGYDVNNKMTGIDGASLLYSAQKGATPEMANELERALTRFIEVVKRQFFIDLDTIPGSGAAGGTGGGLRALLGAELVSGIDLVLDAIDFNTHLKDADMVLVGEGRMDAQSIYHKGPVGVAKRAQALGIPVIAFVGSLGQGYEAVYQFGITKVILLKISAE